MSRRGMSVLIADPAPEAAETLSRYAARSNPAAQPRATTVNRIVPSYDGEPREVQKDPPQDPRCTIRRKSKWSRHLARALKVDGPQNSHRRPHRAQSVEEPRQRPRADSLRR